jgi:hypothetical protein
VYRQGSGSMLSFMMDTRGKVGVGLGKNDDGGIVVTVVSKGGPAETAGLLVGDVLETIDGRAVPGLSTDAAGTMLCGAVDSVVVVKVRRSVLLAPTTVILKMTRCPRVWRACCRVRVSPCQVRTRADLQLQEGHGPKDSPFCTSTGFFNEHGAHNGSEHGLQSERHI